MIKRPSPEPIETRGQIVRGVRFGAKTGRTVFTATDFGSGWYHEAAVQEVEPTKPPGAGERQPQ